MPNEVNLNRLPRFHSGLILKLNEEGRQSFPGKKWATARFRVVRFLDRVDRYGNRLLRLERLDLPSHARQTWSPKWFEEAGDDQE